MGTTVGLQKIRGNQELVRRMNEALILTAVRRYGPISRADIARETGLTSGTVSNLCASLLDKGLIEEQGLGHSNGGRKPVMVQLSTSRYALGIQIGIDEVAVLLVNMANQPVLRRSGPLPIGVEPQHAVDLVGKLVAEILAAGKATAESLLGAGLSLPGSIDSAGDFVLYAPNLRWRNVPLGSLLQERLGMSVLLENDANAAAFGEFWCGAARGLPNLVLIYSEYGIGAGFVVGGELYRGRDRVAGEFGHTTIDINGPRCHCGNRGCLGTLASGLSVISRVWEHRNGEPPARLMDLVAQGMRLDEVIQGAQGGDPVCQTAIRDAAQYLGVGLANLINLYNPQVLVLGGKLPLEAAGYWETATTAAAQRLYPAFRNQVNVMRSTLGPDAPGIGAAALVMEPLFQPVSVSAGA